jgi:hypothetical protein
MNCTIVVLCTLPHRIRLLSPQWLLSPGRHTLSLEVLTADSRTFYNYSSYATTYICSRVPIDSNAVLTVPAGTTGDVIVRAILEKQSHRVEDSQTLHLGQ